MIEFTIPGKPVGKMRPRFTKVGGFVKAYTAEGTVNFESMVKMLAAHEMGARVPLTGPLVLSVVVYVAPPASMSKKLRLEALDYRIWPCKKPDLDNIVKSIMDGMNGVVYQDDSQIIEIRSYKRYDLTDRTAVVVAVRE